MQIQEVLTVIEHTELQKNEETISQGLKTFVEVGGALLSIRDGRLYRAGFGTFEDYCRDRWQISNEYARLNMRAAEVVMNLQKTPTIVGVLPATESQARPLTRLEPEDQPIIWQRAVETAPNGKLTAAHVESVVKEYKTPAITKLPDTTYEQLADELAGDEDGYDWSGDEALSAPDKIFTVISEFGDEETVRVQSGEALRVVPLDAAEPEINEGDEYYTPEYIIDAARSVLGHIDLDPASCERAQTVVQADVYYNKSENGLDKVWGGNVWINPPFSEPKPFVFKLIEEYEAGNVKSAIILTNNSTETQWGQALLLRYPVCFVGASTGRRSRISFWKETPDKPEPSNRYSQMIFYIGKDTQKFFDVFSQFGPILEKKA